MHGSLHRIRHLPATATIPQSICLTATSQPLTRPEWLSCTALVSPSTASRPLNHRLLSSEVVSKTSQSFKRVARTEHSDPPHLAYSHQRKDGRLGQAGHPVEATVKACETGKHKQNDLTRQYVQSVVIPFGPNEVASWQGLVIDIRHKFGGNGAWDVFSEIVDRGRLEILTNSSADTLRDHILAAALTRNERITALFEKAKHLRDVHGYVWPNLYVKTLHFYLQQGDYENAFFWHMRLAPAFPPGVDVFGAFMSSFATNPDPKLQSTLTTMYVFSTYRQLYDHVVPALFKAGRSKLARSWRKKLLLFQDRPLTSRPRPFLQFIHRYYPQVALDKDELDIAGVDKEVATAVATTSNSDHHEISTQPTSAEHLYLSDSFVAKWFASSWTSPEFAINFMHKLGLHVVGPRSLQSLALREYDVQGVFERITQLEKLDIKTSPTTYCKALVFFARQRDETLLFDLVHSDIHPDEFDDVETRQLLMTSAVRQQNWKLERLLQGVEWAIEEKSHARKLNRLLKDNLRHTSLSKSRVILDRMQSLNVDMDPSNAVKLLKRVYEPIGWEHVGKGVQHRFGLNRNPKLDRAIDVTRKLAYQSFPIPLKYWRLLLYNLGRMSRFDELEELSLQIVDFYHPSTGGLIPVHVFDLPDAPGVTRFPDPEPLDGDKDFFSDAQEETMERMTSEHFLSKFFTSNGVERTYDTQQSADRSNTPCVPPEELANQNLTNAQASVERRPPGPKSDGKPNVFKEYISADLPFTHRQHPIQKIFDTSFQRAVVRWGFDKTLAQEPKKTSIVEGKAMTASDFDVACGVRVLATLREQGVLIDKQIVKAAVISRMALGMIPGRRRNRARDSNHFSPSAIKKLVDEAWGEELLSPLPVFVRELEDHKPKLWRRYPRLFGRAYECDQRYRGDKFYPDGNVSGREP